MLFSQVILRVKLYLKTFLLSRKVILRFPKHIHILHFILSLQWYQEITSEILLLKSDN